MIIEDKDDDTLDALLNEENQSQPVLEDSNLDEEEVSQSYDKE